MGSFTVTSSRVLSHPPQAVYNFVSDPHNWPKTYRGSAGMQSTVQTPLAVGDSWTETVGVGDFTCASTWTLLTAVPGRLFEFRQVDEVGAHPTEGGGVDGVTTISYVLEPSALGGTLFTRTLRCELPRGVRIPDPLLVARAQPAGIDGYMDAVQAALDEEAAGAVPAGASDRVAG